MGMRGIRPELERWQLDVDGVCNRMYLAPTPRERERWHALWLLCRGLTASATAEALGRDAHTIGRWATAFNEGGPAALIFEQSGGSPPALREEQQAELQAAVQKTPATAGIALANWNWKVVWQFLSERFGVSLSRSTCLDYLHRLGFAFQRPKKRLLKADEASERPSWQSTPPWRLRLRSPERGYSSLTRPISVPTPSCGGKWVLRGEPALVDSSSPRYGEKASYYSAVCLETGEVEWMELEGNSNSETSAAFLRQLRGRQSGRLNVIWDNAPAHCGEAVREYLRTPGLGLRLMNLPDYSPDFNADEAVWGWAREEATGNLCLGTKTLVQEKVGNFLEGLACRKEEVKRRCRTILQSRAEGLLRNPHPAPHHQPYAHPTSALV